MTRFLKHRLVMTLAMAGAGVCMLLASYPKVRNFESHIFGGGTQTWNIALDTAGCVYFANKYGLIRYDSRRATPYALGNESEVRSILIDRDSGRIYAGGSEEFGYFSHDPGLHGLRYTSVSALLPEGKRIFHEVWNIMRLGRDIWFQEDHNLYRYDGKKVTSFPWPHKITSSGIVEDKIYIGCNDGCLGMVSGGEIVRLEAPGLKEKRIVAILPSDIPGSPMIITEFDGVWRLSGGSAEKIPTVIDGFMHDGQVFCAALSGRHLAVGTVNNGVAILNLDNGAVTYSNRLTGMQNNTVLSLSFDESGNLWAGLDNGVDYICYDSPVRNMLGEGGPCGTGYVTHRAGDIIYLGTNQGLFVAPYPLPSGPVPPMPACLLHGQVWCISDVGGRLMAGTDSGLYLLSGRTATKVEGCPGTISVLPLKDHPGYALASTYENFYLLHDDGAGWKVVGKIDGYAGAGGVPVADDNGNLWLPHWMRGVYRLRLDVDRRRFSLVRIYDSKKGFPSDKGNSVSVYSGNVVFTSLDGYYVYDPVSDSMKKHPTLGNLFPGSDRGRLVTAPSKDIWNLSEPEGISLARRSGAGGYEVDSASFMPLADKLLPGYEHFEFLDNKLAIIGGKDGFYEIDPARTEKGATTHPLQLTRITSLGDSIIRNIGDTGPIRVPHSLNSLRFEVVVPEYRADNAITYSFFLEDYDKNWSAPSTSNFKEYTRLWEGDYRLHVRARNSYNRSVEEIVIPFRVLPPWYRSVWAYIFYALIVLLLIYLGWRLVRRWSMQREARAAREKEEQMLDMKRRTEADAMQKEIEISSLKGAQLEQQVKHKSAELSSAMLNLARKNEILLSISDDLDTLHDTITSSTDSKKAKTQIKKIKTSISENISHDDDWQRFTHNFDAVYEGFTRRLQERHPDITRNELKVCCYLRMGLSSKDIAPLFSISFRSVEMTRYRLRKKLGLQRDDNLVSYLESI